VGNIDLGTEARLGRLKEVPHLVVGHVYTCSAEGGRVARRSGPAGGWRSIPLRRKVDIRGKTRHLPRMIGFLQTIRFVIVAAFTQLLNKKVLFLDSAGARLNIGTAHGKLHCTV